MFNKSLAVCDLRMESPKNAKESVEFGPLGLEALGASGSTKNNSSDPCKCISYIKLVPIGIKKVKLTFNTSLGVVANEKGAVGRATPSRTGAISESAVSHSSSIANLLKDWNSLLHLIIGWF